jgi:magnesium transporter
MTSSGPSAKDAMQEEPERIHADDLVEVWPLLIAEERVEGFRALDPGEAYEFFLNRASLGQAQILLGLPPTERRLWMRLLPPDDAADVLQIVSEEERSDLLALLDDATRHDVVGLLAYAEDEAGGLMNPRFARLRPQMTVDETMSYLRRQARDRTRALYYLYVLDTEQHLQGVVSFRELFSAPGDRAISDIMTSAMVTVPEDLDQEAVARVIARHDLMAVPVVDAQGRMKGMVTVDDIVDVLNEEATEDIQRLGGMEALDLPYWQTGFLAMLRKRGGWLAVLFLGEALTASAMSRFEDELARMLVLALFVPLIISSGGNAGSQATTLIVRAMALGEVRSNDVMRVAGRELTAGLALGALLAAIGFTRVFLWNAMFQSYAENTSGLAFTLALSLLGVVTWGTVVGSLLPFLLRSLKLDPASASAPLVATLVDVSGIIIYFSIAEFLLRGTAF